MVVTRTATGRAPGRVNLIGEHTDYNGGLCLPIAIPQATTATIRRRDDDVVRLVSAQQPGPWVGTVDTCGPGQVTGWAAYAAGVLWALGETGLSIPGMDVDLTSTVPLGAGLSSSASLEAAVAVAVADLLGLGLDDDRRRALVAVCRRAEVEVAGAPTGGLDQTAALLSRDGCALLVDFEDGSVEQVPLALAEAGVTVAVIDTRVTHALVDGGYAARRADCEEAARQLGLSSLRRATSADLSRLAGDRLRRRARHVLGENARVLDAVAAIRADDWSGLGRLLDASHASLRDDYEVSCPELDVAVEAARAGGALGARMTGGGFGGSAIALVPETATTDVRRAVDDAFVSAGFEPAAHFLVTASGPADVVG